MSMIFIKKKLDSYKIINDKIFEFIFSRFLEKHIRRDFIPNKYTFFRTSNCIKNWGDSFHIYFEEQKEKCNKFLGNSNLMSYSVFEFYAGYDSDLINNYLRGYPKCDSNYVVNKINVIEEEIKKFELRENLVVVRKLRYDIFKFKLLKNRKLKTGMVLSDKAFLSTSLDLSYRKNYEGNEEYSNNYVFMLLKIPKGINAVYLESISKKQEFELLLPANLDLIVEKKVRILNNRIVLVSVIDN